VGAIRVPVLLSLAAAAALVLSAAVGVPASRAASPPALTASGLKTEYAHNPLGIDVARPRLSWELSARERAQVQTAYQIQVASSASRLVTGAADVWDSGKVASDRSVNVPYDGPPLASQARYHWRVRAWDRHGEPSGWSAPAWFEMGLLDASDWQARWIGREPPEPPAGDLTLDGASWIWYPEGNPAQDAPAGTRYLRRTVELPAGAAVADARMLVTVDDQFVLYVNGAEAARSDGAPDAWRRSVVADLTARLHAGENAIAIAATNSGGPASAIGKLRVDLAGADDLEIVTDAAWKASREQEPGWDQPGFDDSAWAAALAVAPYGGGPWGRQVEPPQPPTPPAPLLRAGFTVAKPVERARVYVSGLGYSELRLNGTRVGDRVLHPDRDDYDDRVPYETYDVTDALERGPNAIGTELGRGYYALAQPNVWRWHQAPWHDEPKLLLQLEIRYADGTSERIATGEGWRLADGPTVYDSVYGGETYDARLAQPSWDTAGFDASGWQPASAVEPPRGRLTSQQTDPIAVTETVDPVSVTQAAPGVRVFDMGRTMAGWARLAVSGPAGATVTLRYGEKLNADGTVQFGNGLVSGRHQTDEYVLRGDGLETWEPRFSYKGFRYVQVEGPSAATVVGRLVHSDVPQVGDFTSGNELYGTFHEAMQRTILNNLHGIPTDTPMFEKNGWTGDAQLGAPSMMDNFDMARFFTEWLADIRDSQVASGQIPVIVPSPGWGYTELAPSPEWTVVYPVLLWEMYRRYADDRILDEHYESLRRYVEWEISRLDDGIAHTALGDWLPPGYAGGIPPEDTRLTATAYAYRTLRLTSRIAGVLDRDGDAARYAGTADHVRDRFNEVFLNEQEGRYETAKDPGYRQTSNAIPLAFGMVPAEHEQAVAAGLAADIERKDDHLDTGALGTSVLLQVLTDHGYGELAHRVANQRTYPSWGFWFENGADTMWEYWGLDSRSRDHYFFGTVDQWLFERLAGLEPDDAGPGYARFVVKPHPGGGLAEAEAEHRSVRGRIAAGWHADGERFALAVTVPANASATVHVPARDAASVTEGGVPADGAEGVEPLGMEDGYAVFRVGSGTYRFESRRRR
jgi:alpha-L-rhamnosidase